MKEIKTTIVVVRLGQCPGCRDGNSLTRTSFPPKGHAAKFCERCGTSYDVQRRVDVCPICTKHIIEWQGHFPRNCITEGLVKVTILDLSVWNKEFMLDRDGDLWKIPFYKDYEELQSGTPSPTTMKDLRKALDKKTAELNKEVCRMWKNAKKLGLFP